MYTDEAIEEFYKNRETIADSPKKYLFIIQGDWNATFGKQAQRNGCVGRFGIGDMNDRVQKLLEFAERYKFIIGNTLHMHNNSRITKWHSPNELVHLQIEYVRTHQRFKSSIIRISSRTYPSSDINSDHDLVICNLRLKLRSNKRQKTSRLLFNINRLMDPTISKRYLN